MSRMPMCVNAVQRCSKSPRATHRIGWRCMAYCLPVIPIASTNGSPGTARKVWQGSCITVMVERVGGFFDEECSQVRERLCSPPDASAGPVAPARWSLHTIQQTFPFLAHFKHLPSVWKRLRRYGIRLRRGRPHYYSPDPPYRPKEAHLLEALGPGPCSQGQQIAGFAAELLCLKLPPPPLVHCVRS